LTNTIVKLIAHLAHQGNQRYLMAYFRGISITHYKKHATVFPTEALATSAITKYLTYYAILGSKDLTAEHFKLVTRLKL